MAEDEVKPTTPAKKAPAKKTAAKKTTTKKVAGTKAAPAKKAAAKKAVPTKDVPQFGQELTARERRCAMLLALGKTDGKIAKELGQPHGIVSTPTASEDIAAACTKLGVGRHGLIIWAMQRLEGDTLTRQRAAAERRRDQLRASGVMTPTRVQVAMLYSDLEHCDKTQAEIGAMIKPTPIAAAAVGNHVRAMTVNIGPDGSLNKLIAIIALAPFNPRRTGEVAEEPETL